MKRLTVHLTQVKRELVPSGKKRYDEKTKKHIDEKKSILRNTITVGGLRTENDIADALNSIRSKHTIAIAADGTRHYWKAGEEMYHIANEK